MDKTWDGVTERRRTAQDHDTLIEVVQILKNHVKNCDEDRRIVSQHMIDDNKSFERINRNIYMFNGGLIVVNIGIGILLAFRVH